MDFIDHLDFAIHFLQNYNFLEKSLTNIFTQSLVELKIIFLTFDIKINQYLLMKYIFSELPSCSEIQCPTGGVDSN